MPHMPTGQVFKLGLKLCVALWACGLWAFSLVYMNQFALFELLCVCNARGRCCGQTVSLLFLSPCQGGFDEIEIVITSREENPRAGQHLERPVDGPPEADGGDGGVPPAAVGACARRREKRTTSYRAHTATTAVQSMVITFRMLMLQVLAGVVLSSFSEEVVVPLSGVENTDTKTLGANLFLQLEKFVFGIPIRD